MRGGRAGFSLVESLVGLALLAGLALAVAQFSGFGFRGVLTADARMSFETFTSAVSLMVENRENCMEFFPDDVIIADRGGRPALIGTGKVGRFRVPSYGVFSTSSRDSAVAGYLMDLLEIETLKDLSDDGTLVLSQLRIRMKADSSGKSAITALGQPYLYREFYLLTEVNPSTGKVGRCWGGRALAGEQVLRPNLAALPPGEGLKQVAYGPVKAGAEAMGGAGPLPVAGECKGGYVLSAEHRCAIKNTGGPATITPWIGFFPKEYYGYCGTNDAGGQPLSAGRVVVDSASRQKVSFFGGYDTVSAGAWARWTCLEMGRP